MWIVIGIVGVLILMVGIVFFSGIWRSEILRFGGEGERYIAKKPLDIKWTNLDTQKQLRLRIPADYVSRIYTIDENSLDVPSYIRNGGIEIVDLEFYLPDLKPRVGGAGRLRGVPRGDSPAYPKYQEEMSRQITINLSSQSVTYPEKYRKNQYETIVRETKQKHGVYRLPDVHGLEHYRYKACGTPEEKAKLLKTPLADDTAPEGCWDRDNNEIFVSPTDTNGGYYQCARHSDLNLGCRAYVSFDGWDMEYTFKKSHLADWKSIDSAVRQVLNSFRQDGVADQDNPKSPSNFQGEAK